MKMNELSLKIKKNRLNSVKISIKGRLQNLPGWKLFNNRGRTALAELNIYFAIFDEIF